VLGRDQRLGHVDALFLEVAHDTRMQRDGRGQRECDDELAELAELCRGAFDEWADLMREAFEKAGTKPERAQTLALMVEATHEGLFLISRARRSVEPLLIMAAEFETLIDGALPRRRRT
jgi:hypothetical protein